MPGSGAKNGIVISLIDAIGLWPTFLVCLLSLYLWMKVRAIFVLRQHTLSTVAHL